LRFDDLLRKVQRRTYILFPGALNETPFATRDYFVDVADDFVREDLQYE
jgi:hypothetical protein